MGACWVVFCRSRASDKDSCESDFLGTCSPEKGSRTGQGREVSGNVASAGVDLSLVPEGAVASQS